MLYTGKQAAKTHLGLQLTKEVKKENRVRNVQSEDTMRTFLIVCIGEEQVLCILLVLTEMIKVFIS